MVDVQVPYEVLVDRLERQIGAQAKTIHMLEIHAEQKDAQVAALEQELARYQPVKEGQVEPEGRIENGSEGGGEDPERSGGAGSPGKPGRPRQLHSAPPAH